MMAWPSWILAGRLTRHSATQVAAAAGIFAGWDVVLDPQLVQAGYWTWSHPAPGCPASPRCRSPTWPAGCWPASSS